MPRPATQARRTVQAGGPRLAVLALGLALVLAGPTAGVRTAAAEEPEVIRVLTFNLRYDNPRDGDNAWRHRREWVAEIVGAADLAGCQEALRSQIADLAKRLPDHDWWGVGRDDGGETGEFTPIFYRRDRFERLDAGAFWLSPTPEEAGSVGWDAALPRVAAWLRLRDRASGLTLLILNAHLDHRGAEARLESARLLRERAAKLGAGGPAILTGDFNCPPDSPPYLALTGGEDADEAPARLHDSRTLSETPPQGPDSTWNGFEAVSPGQRIDYVFLRGAWRVRSHRTDDAQREGRFPSDHLPVWVELAWRGD